MPGTGARVSSTIFKDVHTGTQNAGRPFAVVEYYLERQCSFLGTVPYFVLKRCVHIGVKTSAVPGHQFRALSVNATLNDSSNDLSHMHKK